jgi:hypothetical protein
MYSDATTLIRVYLTSMLTESASEFLPEFADFYAFLAEIRNCPGVTPRIRLK